MGPDFACSGAMYPVLPLRVPVLVLVTRPAARAMPKSITFTSPSNETSTFCGETSRWTMPSGVPWASASSWAWCRPSAARATRWAETRASIRWRFRSDRTISEDSGLPSTSSITSRQVSVSRTSSCTRATLG